jgi:hypothetical protein
VVVLSPVVFALSVALQMYVAAMSLVNGILTVAPLQIVVLPELVIEGAGFTVTVEVAGLVLVQPFAVAVIEYVAVPGDVVVALRYCTIVEPLEADAPVTAD